MLENHRGQLDYHVGRGWRSNRLKLRVGAHPDPSWVVIGRFVAGAVQIVQTTLI